MFDLDRPGELGFKPSLAEVNVLFLGLPCGFCFCDDWSDFFFLLDVLELEGNWPLALLGGTERDAALAGRGFDF